MTIPAPLSRAALVDAVVSASDAGATFTDADLGSLLSACDLPSDPASVQHLRGDVTAAAQLGRPIGVYVAEGCDADEDAHRLVFAVRDLPADVRRNRESGRFPTAGMVQVEVETYRGRAWLTIPRATLTLYGPRP
jgi:hypothetical protein